MQRNPKSIDMITPVIHMRPFLDTTSIVEDFDGWHSFGIGKNRGARSESDERAPVRLATDFEPRPKLVQTPTKFITQAQQNPQQQQQEYQQQPRVLNFSPQYGPEGVAFTVALQFSSPGKQLKLGFGSLVVETKQLSMPGYTTLSTTVPNFAFTKWHTSKVPLHILVLEDDIVVESWCFGEFAYWEASIKNERKRGSSFSSSDASYGTGLKKINTSAPDIKPKGVQYPETPARFILTNVFNI
ncbi:hypothetical protein BC938DRAFT_477576 [Jimgerdemannia flammicorona]|uniref:Uncharacterized protein n=1 Tax=Jimgerdemannia flammicorona TaxID=994334 RepID=A0A433P8Z1_9FUNG|nr:hypothetical protein BC938DRAFT_477576 [Jimgerdemannia flammicorona]